MKLAHFANSQHFQEWSSRISGLYFLQFSLFIRPAELFNYFLFISYIIRLFFPPPVWAATYINHPRLRIIQLIPLRPAQNSISLLCPQISSNVIGVNHKRTVRLLKRWYIKWHFKILHVLFICHVFYRFGKNLKMLLLEPLSKIFFFFRFHFKGFYVIRHIGCFSKPPVICFFKPFKFKENTVEKKHRSTGVSWSLYL